MQLKAEGVSPVELSEKKGRETKKENNTKEDYGMFQLLKTVAADFLPRSASAEKLEVLWGLRYAKGSIIGASFMSCNCHTKK